MAEPAPSATPLPMRQNKTSNHEPEAPPSVEDTKLNEPTPVFRLHMNDLSHPASSQFLSLVDGSKVLPNALTAIRTHLYPSHPSIKSKSHFHLPPTRSVTVILRPMDGVAYTVGLDLDSSHKEIHFNLNYIRDCTNEPARRRHEIIGVITHEMVHCYQYDGHGTCPGGLIEGIADFVRLKAKLGPPHWFGENGKKHPGSQWDAGYQSTAFFLEWLEGIHGLGTVGRINEALRTSKYDEAKFWENLFGKDKSIKVLWEDYCKAQDEPEEKEKGDKTEEPPKPVPTCATEQPTGTSDASGTSYESDDIVVVEKEKA